MEAHVIVEKMHTYLFKAAEKLSTWLSVELPKAGDGWWEECVISNLSYRQREMAEERHITKLEDFDLAALLRITDKAWYTMRGYLFLPTSERETVRDMISVRNNWSHYSTELPCKEQIIRDICTIDKFMYFLSCEDYALELQDFRTEIETQTVSTPSPHLEAPTKVSPVETFVPTSGEIAEKSQVYLVGSPETKGMVFSIDIVGGIKKYTVFVDGSLRQFYEGQIALIEETPKYTWVDSETLRSYLSAYQINNPSAGNLYSLNSARIDFVPYQFRPALKLIKSDEPRILIADSVGVGKTIEAGLIIKELEARSDLENVMIICPKPLVADRKWENEMKRFDEEFIALDGDALRQAISDTDRDGEWPVRCGKTIVPYSILDKRAYYGEETKRGKKFGLKDLDPAPHFDLVIVDEAHHLRNGSMEMDRAYAYKCVNYFCEHADAVVMLTATPLQTSDDDLYTLLNLLRPDVVIDKQSFAMMARPNQYISQCSHIIRAAKEGWQEEARNMLTNVESTQWGENVIARNPVYEHAVRVLEQESVSREERVNLISEIESLHSFNTMLNRTRRKDIQDFCIRRTHTLESNFTTEQQNLHDSLLTFEVAALSRIHGGKGVKFMMSTIRRQAASCIFGLAPHIRAIIERRFNQLLDDPELDFDEGDFQNLDITTFRSMADDILALADALPEEDPKFDDIYEIIEEKQKQYNNKIIIFSTFRFTLYYLKKRLKDKGIRVAQIDGGVKNDDRLDLRYRFELPKDNKDAIDVLLFTEVGSEGLDYQFCDTMINYDLPWNPMRIEQRIGRIDRRGQVSEVVHIYNAITAGTVDADIYDRCLSRIGVFENSIGECEEILGEIGRQIEKIAMNSNLTAEERRVKLEQIADNEVRKAQELDKLENEEKELFGFDLSNYTVSKEIQEAESPFLTSRSIQHLVEMYLKKRIGEGVYLQGEKELKNLRLNAVARADLLSDLRTVSGVRSSLRRKWEVYLKGNDPNHAITFESETAEKSRNAFFITAVHPLVKQAASYFATNDLVYIHLDYCSDTIPKGNYPMSIYAWNYVGIRSNFRLVVVCQNEELAAELPEYILTSKTDEAIVDVSSENWTALEEKHIKMWSAEKQNHVISTEQLANFKLESIKNNFINQKLVIERRISEAADERIVVMLKSQLENATQRYEQKLSRIQAQVSTADIHTTLIANGIITVK